MGPSLASLAEKVSELMVENKRLMEENTSLNQKLEDLTTFAWHHKAVCECDACQRLDKEIEDFRKNGT